MIATFNPQTTAEQSRKNYRDVTTPAVPEAVRATVEKAVDQSREVYDRSKDALDASVATLERTFDAAGQGAVAFNRNLGDGQTQTRALPLGGKKWLEDARLIFVGYPRASISHANC